MAMLMRNGISPASNQITSAGKSPVPYLLGGVGAMLVLISFALIVLAWSYFKERSTGQDNNRSEPHDVELGDGGKNEMTQDMSKASDDKDEMRVIVIMAGDERPTFIARPTPVVAVVD